MNEHVLASATLRKGQVIEYEIVENRGKQSAENLKVSR
jgi:cold shock CspA family protein